MTVLFFHPSDEMYGADKVLLEVVEAVSQDMDRQEIKVLLPDDLVYPDRLLTRALLANGYRAQVTKLPVMRRANFNLKGIVSLAGSFFSALRVIKRENPSLVYVNTTALGPVVLAAKVRGIPSVAHVHENLSGLDKVIVNFFLAFADRIVVVSEALLEGLSSRNRKRTTVIYNGFDLDGPYPQTPGSEPRYLLASRWNAWKGHASFLHAFSQTTAGHLYIAGGPPISGESVNVPELIEELDLHSRTTLLGELQDLSEALRNCDIVVVPSTKPDPLPTIAIEALAAGRPVLGTKIGGIPEIVEDGVSGWLYEPDGVTEFMNEFSKSIERVDFSDFSGNARADFEKKFSSKRFGLEIQTLVKQVSK